MCVDTKKKIAEGVKKLMKQKEIRKITIQDIVKLTGISRQGFYYHFKDIYDALEWMLVEDVQAEMTKTEGKKIEEVVLSWYEHIESEKKFYTRIVDELRWHQIIFWIQDPFREKIKVFIEQQDKEFKSEQELERAIQFFSSLCCYYFLEYLYMRRDWEKEKVLADVCGMSSILWNNMQDKENIVPFRSSGIVKNLEKIQKISSK